MTRTIHVPTRHVQLGVSIAFIRRSDAKSIDIQASPGWYFRRVIIVVELAGTKRVSDDTVEGKFWHRTAGVDGLAPHSKSWTGTRHTGVESAPRSLRLCSTRHRALSPPARGLPNTSRAFARRVTSPAVAFGRLKPAERREFPSTKSPSLARRSPHSFACGCAARRGRLPSACGELLPPVRRSRDGAAGVVRRCLRTASR
eukprot:scaffold300_cov258-Pinguiococcus_pyrenoidosus.AAC.53